MTTTQENNLRLFIKGLFTAWVPVLAVLGVIHWDTVQTGLIMAASTGSIDALFRIFGVEDSSP